MITCWLSRNIILYRMDTGRALPDWVQKHIHDCPGCQGNYNSASTLERQLSSAPHPAEQSMPPFLHSRIVSALRSEERLEFKPGLNRWGWATTVGICCLLVAGIVWVRQPPHSKELAANSSESRTELALSLNLPTAAQVDQWAKTLDTPLEQETQLVLLDATTALHMLARNFLPDDFLASSTGTGQP